MFMARKHLVAIVTFLMAVMLFTGCFAQDKPNMSIDVEQKTLDTLTKISDGLYIIDCYTDYKVDDYLNSNIKTVQDWDIWMTNNLTKGVPTGNIPKIGCASFSATDSTGNHLFGRNFELAQGDSLIVRTAPGNGYASIGIADLRNLNLGKRGEYDIEDESSQSLLLAAPWAVCDGINEKGLGVSILELGLMHDVTDTDKNDLMIYSATRVLLDKCATVDEAIELLGNYDLYSPRTNTYHLFITDISGRSVVVEWLDGKLQVIESDAVTNSKLYNGEPLICKRYKKISETLESTDFLSNEECMNLLKDVSQTGSCQWSAVYNLNEFSVDICFNEDYDNVYSYSGKIVE